MSKIPDSSIKPLIYVNKNTFAEFSDCTISFLRTQEGKKSAPPILMLEEGKVKPKEPNENLTESKSTMDSEGEANEKKRTAIFVKCSDNEQVGSSISVKSCTITGFSIGILSEAQNSTLIEKSVFSKNGQNITLIDPIFSRIIKNSFQKPYNSNIKLKFFIQIVSEKR